LLLSTECSVADLETFDREVSEHWKALDHQAFTCKNQKEEEEKPKSHKNPKLFYKKRNKKDLSQKEEEEEEEEEKEQNIDGIYIYLGEYGMETAKGRWSTVALECR
jgi:hypothetical protein